MVGRIQRACEFGCKAMAADIVFQCAIVMNACDSSLLGRSGLGNQKNI